MVILVLLSLVLMLVRCDGSDVVQSAIDAVRFVRSGDVESGIDAG